MTEEKGDKELEEDELDEDDEMIIIKWNLFQKDGKKAAQVGYNIEDYMDATAREAYFNRGTKSMDEVYEEVVEKVTEFMCRDENAEYGASDTEPRDVLTYYVSDTLEWLKDEEKQFEKYHDSGIYI
tara:strand:- start:326 stop:703 length:378 start_codon:yes stop_codon:yes gene_type:complete